MVAPRAAYTAIRVILHNGVRAYNPGDPVDAANVEGDHAWLTVGEDVEPSGVIKLDRPALNASQAAWAAYAVSRGMDAGEAADLSRAELIEACED
jgi:hypothetical protein